MTTEVGNDWTSRAQRLADQLTERGDIHDPAWRHAVATVARHVLVPEAYQQNNRGTWVRVDLTSPDGLDLVYSPVTLVTKLADRGTYQEPISSSTKPDLILRMLEILDPSDGDKVLAVGTGSGYTTAVLSRRLGDGQVFSVDVDADLVDRARERLAGLGLYPTLVAGDGAEGLAEHAPFDGIIATCSVRRVPWAWAEQLAPTGRILVDVQTAVSAGNLVLLNRYPDRLEGRFTQGWASFMTMRQDHRTYSSVAQPRDSATRSRLTSTPPKPWDGNRVVWFLAQFGLPESVSMGFELDPTTRKPSAASMSAPDGSWATVSLKGTSGRYAVTESGPTPLWEPVEQAYEAWQHHDRPTWDRIGLTATASEQRVWLDEPENVLSTL